MLNLDFISAADHDLLVLVPRVRDSVAALAIAAQVYACHHAQAEKQPLSHCLVVFPQLGAAPSEQIVSRARRYGYNFKPHVLDLAEGATGEAVVEPKSVVFGGTFDHLHSGHLLLLTQVVLLGGKDSQLTIGLSADELLKNKRHGEVLQSWAYRKQVLAFHLQAMRQGLKLDIFQLRDVAGKAIAGHYDYMVVTEQTVAGGEMVNKLRAERAEPPLQVKVCGLVGKLECKASSSSIRQYLAGKAGLDALQIRSLREQWDSFASGLPFQTLLLLYSGKNRHYHTLRHIYSLLNSETLPLKTREHRLAAFLHDVVYEVGRKDNEHKSAQLLDQLFPQSEMRQRVNQCILATEKHQSKEPGVQQFLDADLGILAAGPEQYAQYADNVKKEYCSVLSEEAYCQGRRAFLEQMLGRKQLFFRAGHLEGQARQNLRRELAHYK